MSFSGTVLKERNEQIVKCISDLKNQRNELNFVIGKQQEEKLKLETEIRRITYKLSLVNKSVSRRIMTRDDYDSTIKEAEENYEKIVESSGILLDTVQKNAEKLEETMDKKIGTDSWPDPNSNSSNKLPVADNQLTENNNHSNSEGKNEFSYFSLTRVI